MGFTIKIMYKIIVQLHIQLSCHWQHRHYGTDPAPKKTGIGYKVFVLKDGKLYPPMVANLDRGETPVGVWLDADAAPVAGESKTGRPQVKAGGKGTQGGSGVLAYRPGWHLGDIPYALQFNRKNPETGERELFPNNFVWAEVEYAADKDYQKEAESYGYNKNGNYQHSLAGLPRLPKDGAYRYRTNPLPETDPWIITGAMKVNKILKPSEVDAIVREAGREPQPRQADAVTDKQIAELNADLGLGESTRYSLKKDETENKVNPTTENTLNKEKVVSSRKNLKNLKDEISERIPQENNRSQIEENGRMAEVANRLKERSLENEGSSGRSKSALSEREALDNELRDVETYAKESGLWLEMADAMKLGEPGPSVNENETFIADNNIVYKLNTLMNSKGVIPLLERLLLHNQYFPETSYELHGFTGFGGGSLYTILKQRFVKNGQNATPEDIRAFMNSLGFKEIGNGAIRIKGEVYLVKTTIKEPIKTNNPSKAQSYEINEIELVAGQNKEAYDSYRYSTNSISATNLLKGIEKSYDPSKKLLKNTETEPQYSLKREPNTETITDTATATAQNLGVKVAIINDATRQFKGAFNPKTGEIENQHRIRNQRG